MNYSQNIQQLTLLNQQAPEVQAAFIKRESSFLEKFIRQFRADRNPADLSIILKFTETILGFLSLKDNTHINDSTLVLLNNMLNTDSELIAKVLGNQVITRNLRDYCINFLKKYQLQCCNNDRPHPKWYFNLYTVVYFLAIFASHKLNLDTQAVGVKKLLDNSLIRQLLQLQFEEKSKSEMYFLFSVLLVKLTRESFSPSSLTLLKNFILPHLSLLSQNEKTLYNYTYCLRTILLRNIPSVQEIKKYKVLDYLISNVKSDGCLLMNSLDSIRIILKSYQSLGSSCIKMGLLDLLKQKYDSHPSAITKVLQRLVLSLHSEEISDLCSVFYGKIRHNKNRNESLYCFTMILQHESPENLLRRLQNGLIDDIEDLVMQKKQSSTVRVALDAFSVIVSTGKTKLPPFYNCILAKIQSSFTIQAAFELGPDTKLLAEEFINNHHIL